MDRFRLTEMPLLGLHRCIGGKVVCYSRNRQGFHTATTGCDTNRPVRLETQSGSRGWGVNRDDPDGLTRHGNLGTASAASRTAPLAWGTPVEIDLGGQHVLYDGTDDRLDARAYEQCRKTNTTPEGIYSLTYKQTGQNLKGAP